MATKSRKIENSKFPKVLETLDHVNQALGIMSVAESSLQASEAECNAKIQTLKNNMNESTKEQRDAYNVYDKLVQEYIEKHRYELFDEKTKTVSLPNGSLSIKKAPARLNISENAVELVKKAKKWARKFIKKTVTEKVDNAVVKAAYKENKISGTELSELGLEIVQNEFYQIKLK